MAVDPQAPVVEPTLPGLELPEYHGRKPVGMKSTIGGTGNRVTGPHEIGDKIVLLVEARLKKAGHEDTDDGLKYVEGYSVVDLFEIPGVGGKRLLSHVRTQHRDDSGGEPALAHDGEDLGPVVTTDGSGVALTPEELAELRNDPVRALVDERATPVLVVFSDGTRCAWPDEFEKDETRPQAGDRFDDEKAPGGYVWAAEILDAETGESLGVWKSEQEEARLEALEAVADAGEDRAATEELEANRRHELADDVPDPTVAEQVDPPGAEISFEGDAPDDELVVDDDPDDAPGPVLPTKADLKFVDCQIADLKPKIAKIKDRDRLARLLAAEEQGRGRDLKPRAGAIECITKRSEELFSELSSIEAPAMPDAGDPFEPMDSEENGVEA